MALTGSLKELSWTDAAAVAGYTAAMKGVSVLACVVPTRRALRIEPTVALKEEN